MLSRALEALAGNPSLSLPKLSEKLGISRKQAQILIKSGTGIGFCRAKKICRLCHSISLLTSGNSIKIAAMDCGYAHPENYTRAFKKHLGFSPSEFLIIDKVSKEKAGALSCPFSISVCKNRPSAVVYGET